MGIYSKDIFVVQTPIILPIMYFVIMLEDLRQPVKDMHLSLTMPTEPKPITFNYPAPPNIIIGNDFNLVFGITPFKINGSGDCRFDLSIKKDSAPVISHSFAIKIRKI